MNYRLVEKSEALRAALLDPLGVLERALLAIANLLKEALEAVPEDAAQEQPVHEATLALKRFSNIAGICARFRGFEDCPDEVFWLDRGKTAQGEAFARLCITPLDISGRMNEAVFEPYRAVICVSATLAVAGSFEFWKRRVGLYLADQRALCEDFPSPFPFERNALLCAPSDAPDPSAPHWQEWINEAVGRLVQASEGRALVLFTSYTSLRSAWEAVKPRLDALGISAFKQGDDERSRLLDRFKSDIASVLFATDSFWEGVDAPGDTLKLVIITKLPFRVPTDPVQMARAEAIERRGGNAFMDLSLPEAVIRFKQGFGRLIRHSDDTGAVAVLDVRLLKKRYGPLFVSSLPKTRSSFKPLDALIEDLRDFLALP